MDGLVLAGGTCPEDLKALTGCSKKGDLQIKGNRLVEIVVSALKDVLRDGKIIVVGNEVKGCVTISAGVTFIESLEKGLAHVTSEDVLICTEDLPFVTGDSFLRLFSASDPRAEVNYPIVPIEACKRIFPDLKRTTVQTKEGRFTGGNAIVTKTEAVRKMFPILSEVYKKRKYPFAIARMIGWGMLLRAVAANVFPALLSIRDIEERVCAMMGVSMRAVILNDPALATDVDTKEHFEAVLCYVEKLSQPTPP